MQVTATAGNPFPGLRPFDQRDSRVFFGRDDHIDALLSRLDGSRFIAVVGSSASGKSSLVRAGLLPALRGGHLTSAGSRWRIAVMRPGGEAVANLAGALEACGALGGDGDPSTRLGLARAVLESGELGLSEIVAQSQRAETKNLLLVVDQFEELFRFRENRDGAAAFVKLLLASTAVPEPPIYVLVTMRSDFLGDCSEFRDLPETISDGLFLVPRPTRDQLREAIEGPVSIAGATIEPALVTQVLNDLGNSPDQLPVLAHALMRTWDIWASGDSDAAIGVSEFAATGGLETALSQHGDDLYQSLSPQRQTVAERTFRALTDRSDGKRGVRRPTSIAKLVAITGASAEEIREVVDVFRAPGCAFLGPPQPTTLRDETIVDISHESLMRVWARLAHWASEEADSARVFRRIADAAELHACGKGALLIDPALKSDLAWRASTEPTRAWAERYAPGFELAMRFLDASARARDEQRAQAARAKRRRVSSLSAFSLALVLLAVALAGTVALLRERGATLAAQSRGLAREAQNAIDRGDAVTGMLVALQALPEHIDHPDRPFVLAAQDALQRAVATRRELRDYTEHTAGVFAAVFSPDGKRVATSSSDGARIWDAATGKTLGVLRGNFGGLGWSADGKRLVTGGADAIVRTWDAKTFEPLVTMRGHGQAVFWTEFSPDGTRILTASQDRTTRIFDAATGRQLRRFKLHGISQAAGFFPDGRHIVTGPIGGPVRIWDAVTGKRVLDLQGDLSGNLVLAISSDGKRIATGGYNDKVQVWDARNGREIYTIREPDSIFHAVSFSPDNTLLAMSWHNTRLQICDARTGASLFVMGEHGARIWSARFSPDSKRLVSASGDHTARIWNVAPEPARFLRANAIGLSSADPSPDGTLVVTSAPDHMIRIWNVHDATVRRTFRDGLSSAFETHSVAFSHDGRRIVSSGGDGSIRIWDAANGKRLRLIEGHRGPADQAMFSPDDRTVLSGGDDATIRTWNVATGAPKLLVHVSNSVDSLDYSRDGRLILVGNVDGASVRDAHTGKLVVTTLKQDGGAYGVGFAPDGKTFIAGYGEGLARIWSAQDGKLLRVLRGHDSRITAASFSPNGNLAVTASGDLTERIWDPRTGTTLYVVHQGETPVESSVFTADGTWLVTAGDDGTAIVRTLPTFARCQAMIDQARASLPRQLSAEQRETESISSRGSTLAGPFMGGETCR